MVAAGAPLDRRRRCLCMVVAPVAKQAGCHRVRVRLCAGRLHGAAHRSHVASRAGSTHPVGAAWPRPRHRPLDTPPRRAVLRLDRSRCAVGPSAGPLDVPCSTGHPRIRGARPFRTRVAAVGPSARRNGPRCRGGRHSADPRATAQPDQHPSAPHPRGGVHVRLGTAAPPLTVRAETARRLLRPPCGCVERNGPDAARPRGHQLPDDHTARDCSDRLLGQPPRPAHHRSCGARSVRHTHVARRQHTVRPARVPHRPARILVPCVVARVAAHQPRRGLARSCWCACAAARTCALRARTACHLRRPTGDHGRCAPALAQPQPVRAGLCPRGGDGVADPAAWHALSRRDRHGNESAEVGSRRARACVRRGCNRVRVHGPVAFAPGGPFGRSSVVLGQHRTLWHGHRRPRRGGPLGEQ
ncbi:unannotated protein [freshwater metagenome]|uniref:Unannotated protein n=1 Tax=freshwater metagenome TaxID=449393 RepID=A0A6J7F5S5_9ZZZZ